MAARTRRYRNDNDDEGYAPRRSSGGLPPQAQAGIAIVGIVVVLFGVAMMFNTGGSKAQEPAGSGVGNVDPFHDLPPEEFDEPTRKNYTGGGSGFARAKTVPAALADSLDWQQATEAADAAYALGDEVAKLREEGGLAWREKGKEAKEGFDRALQLTEPWVNRLASELGERDMEYQAFLAKRKAWNDQRRMYHKLGL